MMLVGVGGQGTLLASRVLGNLFKQSGFQVKVSEVHGMSQRGGSVVTYIRWGSQVYSPVVDKGQADFLVAFELCEAARWCGWLRPQGKLIANSRKIMPMPVLTGTCEYPQNLEQKLAGICTDPVILDALSAAEQAGNARAVNIVLLGALSRFLELGQHAWETALAVSLKPEQLDTNILAFRAGRALVP